MRLAHTLLSASPLLACVLLAGCGNGPSTSNAAAPQASANTSAANAPSASSGGDVILPPEPEVPKEVIPSHKPDKALTVGVSLLARAHPFYKDMEAAMQEEAAKQGMKLNIQSAEFDASKQMDQVQTFISQHVDAIILCPVNSQGSGSAVQLANEAKIPVFTADIASKSGDVVCHVASNNEQGGTLVGEWLGKKLGKGDIAIIDFPTVTSVQERVKGFETAIAKYPGIKIVAKPAPEQTDEARAFPVAQDLLQSHPTLKGIFAINDACGRGVIQAATATHRDDLVLVTMDGDQQAIQYIRQGSILKADAAQFPKTIGRATVDAIAKHAIGETVPKSAPVPCALITRKE